ncbi:reticulon-4-like [Epinephelus moara]|uniref:reticulon-4-like n=1 Tax=Epinephelus moara TaxID=300413 RepID=UPI00214F1F0C|nr:reticulon-4-like [Epinephelus moara]
MKKPQGQILRLRKKLASRSGDPGGKKVPAFYTFLSWLAPHVKHRETESNYDAQEGTPSLQTFPASSMEPLSPSSDDPPPSSCSQQPTVSTQPSLLPSVCTQPSLLPSVSTQPSLLPSMSTQPSLLPSVSTQPSPLPSTSTPSPLLSPLSSPVSPMGQNRKRRDQDELFMKQLAEFHDKRLELHQRLAQDTRDECSRFGETVADFLRRVPDEKRPDATFTVLQLLHDSVKQQ